MAEIESFFRLLFVFILDKLNAPLGKTVSYLFFLSQNCNEKAVWKNAEGAVNPRLYSPFFLNL